MPSPGAAHEAAMKQQLHSAAEAAAVQAIQELENAAKRAAAAARRHHERLRGLDHGR